MSITATRTDVWAERRRRVAELRLRQGFVRQLLDFYGALLGVQEKAFVEAAADAPPPQALAAYVAEVVFPTVVDVSVAAGPDRLRASVLGLAYKDDARATIESWMKGKEQAAVERFLARASLGPVLEALGPEARQRCNGPRDARHCPECGGSPQVSFFAPASDDLASGPRCLVCARCATTWTYTRMTCAGCGEDASAKLRVFSERGTSSGERGSVVRGLPGGAAVTERDAIFPHMRIEACDTCRAYLLSVDVAADRTAVPLVDELSAIPLDLYARERGYTKVITNLMGF
jgi:Protein involved in formate dehydrogenase formation